MLHEKRKIVWKMGNGSKNESAKRVDVGDVGTQ